MYLTLDNALNLLWLGMTLAGLACFGIFAARRKGAGKAQGFLALAVVALVFFPSVSDSDDLFSFSLLGGERSRQAGPGNAPAEDGKEKAGQQLVRLLEFLDHYQPAEGPAPALFLVCLAILASYRPLSLERAVACRGGRAPPAL